MTPDVNLLPIGFRRRAAAKHILFRWALFAAVLLVVAFAVGIRYSQDEAKMAMRIAMAEEQAMPVKSIAKQSRKLRGEIALLSSKWELMSRLKANDDVLQSIGVVGVACKQVDNKVRVKSIQLTFDPAARIGTKKKSSGGKRKSTEQADSENRLVMQINAETDAVATELIENLKAAPRVRSIELRSAGGVKGSTSRLMEIEGDLVSSEDKL